MRIAIGLLVLFLSATTTFADCMHLRGTNQVVAAQECFGSSFEDTCDSAFGNAVRASTCDQLERAGWFDFSDQSFSDKQEVERLANRQSLPNAGGMNTLQLAQAAPYPGSWPGYGYPQQAYQTPQYPQAVYPPQRAYPLPQAQPGYGVAQQQAKAKQPSRTSEAQPQQPYYPPQYGYQPYYPAPYPYPYPPAQPLYYPQQAQPSAPPAQFQQPQYQPPQRSAFRQNFSEAYARQFGKGMGEVSANAIGGLITYGLGSLLLQSNGLGWTDLVSTSTQ